ncbi:MAG: hypothetical protein ACXVW0_09480 [Nocardioides sp.]
MKAHELATLAPLLVFVQERAKDDLDRRCRTCPRDELTDDVVVVARHMVQRAWARRTLDRRSVEHLVDLAVLHERHPDFQNAWRGLGVRLAG